LGVCLSLAAAGQAVAPVFVPVERFTLAWTHSIEKVRWEEDYAVRLGDGLGAPPVLQALAARVRGSGAGMEPPPGSVLRHGWYEYTPQTLTPEGLRLTRSPFTADYDWCTSAGCVSMARLLPSDGGITLLAPCTPPTSR
jgi:hypothetical protein